MHTSSCNINQQNSFLGRLVQMSDRNQASVISIYTLRARCRFLGGFRFTLGALHQILWQRTHQLRVAYLPAEDAAAPASSVVRFD